MRKIDWAYIAGFFDGEGTVSIMVSEKLLDRRFFFSFRIAAAIPQKKKDVLERIQSMMRKDVICRVSDRGNFCLLSVVGWQACRFYREIYPYSILKKKQIVILLKEFVPLMKRTVNIHYSRDREMFWSEQRTVKDIIALFKIKERIDSLKGGRRGKYNVNYVRRIYGYKLRPNIDKRPQIENMGTVNYPFSGC